MVAIIEPSDLDGLMPSGWDQTKVQREIDAALGWVRIYVPCLDNLSDGGVASVKAVLLKAVPYNAKMATSPSGGEVRTAAAGPLTFTTETRAPRDSGTYFSPGQVAVLEGLCRVSRGHRVGTIRTRPL